MSTDEENGSPKNNSGLSHNNQFSQAQNFAELDEEHEQTLWERSSNQTHYPFSNLTIPDMPSRSSTPQEVYGYSSKRTVYPPNNLQDRIGKRPGSNAPPSDKEYNYLNDTVVSSHRSQNLPTAERSDYLSASQKRQGDSNSDHSTADSSLEMRGNVTSQESEMFFPLSSTGPLAESRSVPEHRSSLSHNGELCYDKYFVQLDEEYEKTLPEFESILPVLSEEPVAVSSYVPNSECGFYHNDEFPHFNNLRVGGDVTPEGRDAQRNLEHEFLNGTALSSRHSQNISIAETSSHSSIRRERQGYSNSDAERYLEHRAFTQARSSDESGIFSVMNMSFRDRMSIPVTNTDFRSSSYLNLKDMEARNNPSKLPSFCETYKRNAISGINIAQGLISEHVMSGISSTNIYEMGNAHYVEPARDRNDNESPTIPQQTHSTRSDHLMRKHTSEPSMSYMPGQSNTPAVGRLISSDVARQVSDGYFPNFDRSQQTRDDNSKFPDLNPSTRRNPDFKKHSNVCDDKRKQWKKYVKDTSGNCGKQLRSWYQTNVNNDREEAFVCDICGKSFTKNNLLTRHKRIHTGEKPFTCDICIKRFNRKDSLTMHLRTHTGDKPYHCDVCNKRFSLKRYLKGHSRTHTGEKRFNCDVCNKCFSRKRNLINHSRTHTGEKPFKCDVCNKRFSRKDKLKTHLRSHT